jgi:transcriptional regulator with XRE-family HTH domain
MNLTQLLDGYMRILGISDQKLARETNVDKATINRWRNGTRPSANKGCKALCQAIHFFKTKAKLLRIEARAKGLDSFSGEQVLSDFQLELEQLSNQFEKRAEKWKAKKTKDLLEEYPEGLDMAAKIFQRIVAAEALELKAQDLEENYPKYKSKDAPELRNKASCLKAEALELIGDPSQLLKAARCLDDESPSLPSPIMETEKRYLVMIDGLYMTDEQANEAVKRLREIFDEPSITLLSKEKVI